MWHCVVVMVLQVLSRMWQSGLVKGVRRSASGVMAVALYYADVYSDVSVLLLLYETGHFKPASQSV